MNIVLVHGYLLQGTGSNIYVVNIAKTWKKQGHSVTVVCQDPDAGGLPFVDEFISENDPLPSEPPKPGTLRVVVPEIGRLLPVYVFDKYEGYKVKTIPDMSSEEIEQHISMTSEMLRKVCLLGTDMVLANHVMLSPVITRRALAGLDIPFNVKIHGSAVEYTLVPNPHLMNYALEGLENAKRIIAGTRYVKQRVLDVFDEHSEMLDLKNKFRIVPPGMDPDIFQLPDNFAQQQDRFKEKIKAAIMDNPNGRKNVIIPSAGESSLDAFNETLQQLGETYDQRTADADLLQRWPDLKAEEPLIVYFGKFLPAKGIGELMLCIPAVLEKIPQARFLFIGFGSFREHLEGILQAFKTGDLQGCIECAGAGGFVEGIDFEKSFRKLSKQEAERILFTGFLNHDQLKEILPLCDVCIVPSKLAEAFGMVAVEAMAAGVLPICNYHSGLGDVIDAVTDDLPEIKELVSMDKENFASLLPKKIFDALDYLFPNDFEDTNFRKETAGRLRAVSKEKFSWDGICRKLAE